MAWYYNSVYNSCPLGTRIIPIALVHDIYLRVAGQYSHSLTYTALIIDK